MVTGVWGLWTLPQLFAVRILSALGLGVFVPAAFSLMGDLFRIRSWRWVLLKEVLDALSISILFGWSFTWLDTLGLGNAAFLVMLLMTLLVQRRAHLPTKIEL